jgi:hypothetical protein
MFPQASIDLAQEVGTNDSKHSNYSLPGDVPEQLHLRLAVTIEAGSLGGKQYLERIDTFEVARQGHHHDHGRNIVGSIVRHDDRGASVINLA